MLVCHDPMIKLASRPGAAPGRRRFGVSAAQLVRDLRKEKIGAVAENCTRTVPVRKDLRGRETFCC